MVSKVGGPPGGKPPGGAPADEGEEDSAIYTQLKKFINVIVSSNTNLAPGRATIKCFISIKICIRLTSPVHHG